MLMERMETKCWIAFVLIFITMDTSTHVVARPEDCGQRLRNCTTMIRPFLHDLKYMFPTTIDDVDKMCRIWGSFVDCIRYYTKDCATADQRRRFNDAVGDSMDTVRAVCSSEKYQKEYLQSATCFRKVSVEKCGSHYNDLVEEVTNTVINNDNICWLSFECPKSGRGRLDPDGTTNEMNTSEASIGLTNSTSNASQSGQGEDRVSGASSSSTSSGVSGSSKTSPIGSDTGGTVADSPRRTSLESTHHSSPGSSPKDTFEIDFENSIGTSFGSPPGNAGDPDDFGGTGRSSKRPPPFFGSRLQRNYENSASSPPLAASMSVFLAVLILAFILW